MIFASEILELRANGGEGREEVHHCVCRSSLSCCSQCGASSLPSVPNIPILGTSLSQFLQRINFSSLVGVREKDLPVYTRGEGGSLGLYIFLIKHDFIPPHDLSLRFLASWIPEFFWEQSDLLLDNQPLSPMHFSLIFSTQWN